uniref:(northern house mosquito) hypothetical protein n=2 Tax=Culex pipiens TaxID=7175 RepID=A0A8D8P5M4_CULPI
MMSGHKSFGTLELWMHTNARKSTSVKSRSYPELFSKQLQQQQQTQPSSCANTRSLMSRVVLTLLLRLPAPYDPRSKQARAGDSAVCGGGGNATGVEEVALCQVTNFDTKPQYRSVSL